MKSRNHHYRIPILSMMAATALAVSAGQAYAADPTTADCLAASDASLKLGNEHKLRAQRAQLLVCAASTCPTDVRKECLSRVEAVNVQIPTITFSAKDAVGADLSAVKVVMDGEVLAERLEGTSLSIDPGVHTFTFEMGTYPTVIRQFVIIQGQKERRELVIFGALDGRSPEGASAAGPVGGGPQQHPAAGLGGQRVLALVAGGLGVVGLGVGVGFGVAAISKKSDAQRICTNQCATQEGVNEWGDVKAAGNVSTVGFVVSAVGIAGAAALWFTAPSLGEGSGAQLGLGVGGLRVRGTW